MLILEKNILAIFRIIFQKIDVISDVIIAIAAILNFIFYHFFCNITKYDCAKFHVKSIFLSGFMPPGAWSDKNTLGLIGLKFSFFSESF